MAVQQGRFRCIKFKIPQEWRIKDRFSHTTIIDQNFGVFEPASVYLRELLFYRSLSAGTLYDVAGIICKWVNYVDSQAKSWDEATSWDLLGWVKQTGTAGEVDSNRRTRIYGVIFRWLRFLAGRQIGGDRVRLLAASLSDDPINVSQISTESRFKVGLGSKIYEPTYIPSDEEASRVLEELAGDGDTFLRERNWLIAKTLESTGLRAMGVTAMSCETVAQLLRSRGVISTQPIESLALDQQGRARVRKGLNDLRRQGVEKLYVQITEKGQRTRFVGFPISLISMILDYIWGARHAFARSRVCGQSLWLSHKTGLGLTTGTIKDFIKKGFLDAKVSQGSAHSFRGLYLTRTAETLVADAIEKFGVNFDSSAILLILAEIAGHKDPKTLKPYIKQARIAAVRARQLPPTISRDESAASSH